MNKLIIPLLAASALLGGCQHVTVRHTVQLPVEVVDHRHIHNGVVIVHQHGGDYRHPHQHEHYDHHDRGRVVVVTPAPRIVHREVTVIERNGRGHHATPRVPPSQQPPAHQGHPPLPPQHGRPQHPGQTHPQPRRGEGRGDTHERSRGETTPPPHREPPPRPRGEQGRGDQKKQQPDRGKSPAGKKEKEKPDQNHNGNDKGKPSEEADSQERGHR
jgi:hypothetical protein